MANTVSWGAFANTKLGEVERPKVIPLGHYVGNIVGAGELKEAGQNSNLVIEFPAKLTEPLSDVDAEEFEASSGFNAKGYTASWWIMPDALYRFTDFGKAIGASDDLSVPELGEFIATSGEPVVFEVTHREGKNGSVFAQLNNPVPLSLWNEQQGE